MAKKGDSEVTPITTEQPGAEIDAANNNEEVVDAPNLNDNRSSVMEQMAAESARERGFEVQEEGKTEPTADGDGDGEPPADEGDKPPVDGDGDEPPAEGDGDEPTADGEEGEEPPAGEDTDAPEIVKGEGGETLLKLVVDGKEKTMTLKDAQTELQRREAGTERLQRAANERRQIDVERQALERQRQQQPPQPQATEPSEATLATAKEIVSKVLSNEPDAAAEALASAIENASKAGAPATGNDDSVVEQAAYRAAQMAENRRQESAAIAKFEQEFPEIAADKAMFAYADQVSVQVAGDNPDMAPEDIVMETGRRVRESLKLTPPTEETKPSKPVARENPAQRKKNITRMPPTGSQSEQLNAQDGENKPKSLEDQVAEMNASRTGMKRSAA